MLSALAAADGHLARKVNSLNCLPRTLFTVDCWLPVTQFAGQAEQRFETGIRNSKTEFSMHQI